jgi:uncharacterized repeat protein (TIGR02543 family)
MEDRYRYSSRRYRVRKRRWVVPAVFTVALLIAGQVYEAQSPSPSGQAAEGASFANDASEQLQGESGAAEAGAGEEEAVIDVRSEAEATFYAGDDAVVTEHIVPNDNGGYDALPDAEKSGYDFEGWYTERTGGELVSASQAPEVSDGDTLYARWHKTSYGADTSVRGLPVLMYHWFYDLEQGDPAPTTLLNNWMKTSEFEAEVAGLVDAGYYFPDWDEVYAYVLGEIDLPGKSIVITIDDGKKSFYEYAIPILEEYGARGTGFIIAQKVTKKKVKKYSSDLISLQSHTYAMHGGTGGDGLIELLPFEEAVTDLTSAAAILGTTDALAYPYGYYDDEAVRVVGAAGIRMAFGTSGGRVYPGMDPLRLPRVRVSSAQSSEAFLAAYR